MDLVGRAKRILTTPKTEWPMIAGESTSRAELFCGYVLPLAAIPGVAGIIGNSLISGRVGFVEGIVIAVISVAIGIVGVFVLGLIASKIAPSFGGKDDLRQGLKLVAYAYTAQWVAGVINVVPALSLLIFVGSIYSLYLLYAGAHVMSVPDDRKGGYTAVVILVAIGVYIVISIIVGVIIGVTAFVR